MDREGESEHICGMTRYFLLFIVRRALYLLGSWHGLELAWACSGVMGMGGWAKLELATVVISMHVANEKRRSAHSRSAERSGLAFLIWSHTAVMVLGSV
jgi:hypothetical protein